MDVGLLPARLGTPEGDHGGRQSGGRRNEGPVVDDDRGHELCGPAAVDHGDIGLGQPRPPVGLAGIDGDPLPHRGGADEQLAHVILAGVHDDAGGLLRIGQRQHDQIVALHRRVCAAVIAQCSSHQNARRADRDLQRAGLPQRARGDVEVARTRRRGRPQCGGKLVTGQRVEIQRRWLLRGLRIVGAHRGRDHHRAIAVRGLHIAAFEQAQRQHHLVAAQRPHLMQ